ncbi:LysM peptidoglycan-binding domain-containing protein [Dyella sp. 2RAB6]|uniref:LysM peptidoglycan-binding domain-containing protein n=1 Tax=Dyella sp. 2RAB6 TaxID=3232992 RepID=UPI003F92D865
MGISGVFKNDPLLQLLGGGHGAQGNGHVQLSFPMSPGDTVSTIADKLGLPLDGLLRVNPGMSANTPLSAGLTVQLPVSSFGDLNGNWGDRGNGQVGNPSGHELPLLPELADALRGTARIDGIQLGVTLSTANLQAVPLIAAGALNSADIAAQAARNPLAGWPGGTAPGSAPVNYVQGADRGGTVATGLPASSLGAARADGMVLSFAQAAGVLAQAAMNHQHGNDSVPPPPPMPWLDSTRPALVATPMAWQAVPQGLSPAGWSVAAAAVDGNEAKLQIMALLMAQLGQAAAGNAGAANVQTPGFIDPQAVAAQAAAMRAGRNIDLGAGRSLQFTLVQDRMRRVGAVGEEERAAAGRRPNEAEVKPAREQRAGEAEAAQEDRDRRRRAAEAAMRRRSRKLSTRCRPRRGPRLPLCEPGRARYPQTVDWAEFRGRLPPRYLWGSAPDAP